MASKRALFALPLRSASSIRARPQFLLPTRTSAALPPTFNPALKPLSQARWHSSPVEKSKPYAFEDVKKLIEKDDEDVVLIDVREPPEFAAGAIPTALNLPISSQPDALFLPPDEFEDRFGFQKPDIGKEVVFYCKAGVRSAAAAQLARQGGWERVGEYRGSWLDWERRGGKIEK
ncbi:Rhodanese-like protein [Mytilinidion resinicola]|uniref:Rhodanese-like protein n=1 Tax=Mytilinidion resinicola TaxID=574789 RepID=A0A6A6Z8U5_9PEZI|nr:Rhodanese-like protein [Mytilinidion resinicola]KAF2817440.1 Rhodanese-like protein [Mytilinidion resinicola]